MIMYKQKPMNPVEE